MQQVDTEREEARAGPLRTANATTLRLVVTAWAGCVGICVVLAALAAMTAMSMLGVNLFFAIDWTPMLAKEAAAVLLKMLTCVILTLERSHVHCAVTQQLAHVLTSYVYASMHMHECFCFCDA